MKFTTIYLDGHQIELFNSLLGKERVVVNGKEVSSKYSFTGTEHQFTVPGKDAPIPYKLTTGLGVNGVVIDLYKNNQPIIVSPRSNFIWVVLLIFIVSVVLNVVVSFL